MARPRATTTAALAATATAAALLAWWLQAGPGMPAAPAEPVAAAPAALVVPGQASAAPGPHAAGEPADALLAPGLRDTLEALLLDAGEADDPAALKQRLAARVPRHFPAALATRALALAERYVDYRVALGRLRGAPAGLADPAALRDALQARHRVRTQFFDDAEYDALFGREADLDRYTLARLEIAHNTQLTPAQRAQALAAAEQELPEARRTERSTATQHMAAAAQTAAFNTQNTDVHARHAARSAQYGEGAAHALAQLDREEQHWQQRLDQYQQALSQAGGAGTLTEREHLRAQWFTPQEQLRVDAALALRAASR